jgi:hypothetical protein
MLHPTKRKTEKFKFLFNNCICMLLMYIGHYTFLLLPNSVVSAPNRDYSHPGGTTILQNVE